MLNGLLDTVPVIDFDCRSELSRGVSSMKTIGIFCAAKRYSSGVSIPNVMTATPSTSRASIRWMHNSMLFKLWFVEPISTS
jgi:hypothetical protein